jgi:hypothetical protein
MVWKPKERELTREEAIEEARKTLAPYWYNSKPLFMASFLEQQVRIFPIDESFAQESWMIAFLDPFSPSGLTALKYIKTLHERHAPHQVNTCVVLRSPFGFARDRTQLEAFLDGEALRFPVVFDSDGQIHRGFQTQDLEAVNYCLYDAGLCQAKADGRVAPEGWEKEIQGFLRNRDPGLSLRPLLDSQSYHVNVRSQELSLKQVTNKSIKNLQWQGEWTEDGQGLLSKDPHSGLDITTASSRVYLLVERKGKPSVPLQINVSVNGVPVIQELRGSAIVEDDYGRTSVPVKSGQVCEILARESEGEHKLEQLRIEALSTDEAQVVLHRLFFDEG